MSCEELDFMVVRAESLAGAFGAWITGGGFGGCSMNLVRTKDAHSVAGVVPMAYEEIYQRSEHFPPMNQRGVSRHIWESSPQLRNQHMATDD